jgi:virginiamycin B lyase
MPPNSENHSSKVWFTEQSENKIGYVDLEKAIPITLTVNPSSLNFSGQENNETLKIDIHVNLKGLNNNKLTDQPYFTEEGNMALKPVISGTFTPNGDINGLQATIRPEILNIHPDQNPMNSDAKTISFNISLKHVRYIAPGNYNLMVGVESHDFTIMKKVKLNVAN